MDSTNHSRPVKFDPGTLVVYGGEVCLVDHNSGEQMCHLKRGDDIIKVPERFLRKMKWAEFCLFIHPLTGHMMCGKTRGYMAVIIHLFGLILIGVGIATWADGSTWTAIVIGVAILVLFWVGTWKNHTGKWR